MGWLPSTPDSRVLPPPATRLQAPRCRGEVHCLHQVRVIVVAAAVDAQCHVRPRGRVRRIATGVAAINAGAPLERARVPADAAAVAIRRARAVRPGRRRGATGTAALARDHPAASTRCGRPSRGHAMPCHASVLAPGVTKCRWRRHRCPYRASPVPLEGPPSTRAAHVWPPPAAGGHGCRCAEVSALLAPSARHHRGRCRRRAVPMRRRRGSAARCPGGRGRRRKRCEDGPALQEAAATGAHAARRHGRRRLCSPTSSAYLVVWRPPRCGGGLGRPRAPTCKAEL